jgi:hypothetical protein
VLAYEDHEVAVPCEHDIREPVAQSILSRRRLGWIRDLEAFEELGGAAKGSHFAVRV